MKTAFVAAAMALLLLLAACAGAQDPNDLERTRCKRDIDCVCGGTDRLTGKCFIGNREYFDQFVDRNKECPDFCGGIAGDLQTRCVSGTCKQVQPQAAQPAECASDADCRAGGCSGQVCAPANAAQSIITTCEFTAEYACLKTHASCGCVGGTCGWSKAPDFAQCLAQQDLGGERLA